MKEDQDKPDMVGAFANSAQPKPYRIQQQGDYTPMSGAMIRPFIDSDDDEPAWRLV